MNSAINNSIQNQTNFQARIKIDKKEATKLLIPATALVTTGLYTIGTTLQQPVGESFQGVDLGSVNNIESVKNYIQGGIQDAIDEHNFLETNDYPDNYNPAVSRTVVSSAGILSSSTGSYLSNIASASLYDENAKKDLNRTESKNIPS